MSNSYIYEVEQLQAKSRLRDEQKDAEIERLRADLAAMSDSVQVAAQALNDEERDNERLRELVRDAWKCAIDDVGSPFWEQTEKRVREALGE